MALSQVNSSVYQCIRLQFLQMLHLSTIVILLFFCKGNEVYIYIIIIFGIYTRCQQMKVKVMCRKFECRKDIHYKTQTGTSCEKCNSKAYCMCKADADEMLDEWPEGCPKRKIGFVGFLRVCFQFRYFFENRPSLCCILF